jgi:hypothetical protein
MQVEWDIDGKSREKATVMDAKKASTIGMHVG